MTKKILLILSGIIWLSCLVILIIALTNLFPDNPFKEYRLVAGIAFIAVSGFLGKVCKHKIKNNLTP